MSFIFSESFDWYSAIADMQDRGWTHHVSAGIETSTVKDGRACLYQQYTYACRWDFLATTTDYVYVSVWFRAANIITVAKDLIEFMCNSGGYYYALGVDNIGRLVFHYYSPATVHATSVNRLKQDTWYHLEVKFKTGDSVGAGDISCKVNGDEWLAVPAATDTHYSGTANMSGIVLGSSGGAGKFFWDNLVIWDAGGAGTWSTWQGRLRTETLMPNGNGNSSDFVGQDADSTDNYLNVDEEPNDGDTTYNESNTVSEKDLYTYENLTGNITSISGVNVVCYAKATGSTTRKVKQLVRTAATDYQGATEHLMVQDTYDHYDDQWLVNPNTTNAWSEAEVNGAEFGVEVTT